YPVILTPAERLLGIAEDLSKEIVRLGRYMINVVSCYQRRGFFESIANKAGRFKNFVEFFVFRTPGRQLFAKFGKPLLLRLEFLHAGVGILTPHGTFGFLPLKFGQFRTLDTVTIGVVPRLGSFQY